MRPPTTGKVARELRAIFPQVTDDHIRKDVENGTLKTYPRFSENGRHYVDPEGLEDYIKMKLRISQAEVKPDLLREVLAKLNANFKQTRLVLIA